MYACWLVQETTRSWSPLDLVRNLIDRVLIARWVSNGDVAISILFSIVYGLRVLKKDLHETPVNTTWTDYELRRGLRKTFVVSPTRFPDPFKMLPLFPISKQTSQIAIATPVGNYLIFSVRDSRSGGEITYVNSRKFPRRFDLEEIVLKNMNSDGGGVPIHVGSRRYWIATPWTWAGLFEIRIAHWNLFLFCSRRWFSIAQWIVVLGDRAPPKWNWFSLEA